MTPLLWGAAYISMGLLIGEGCRWAEGLRGKNVRIAPLMMVWVAWPLLLALATFNRHKT
jgi:hypothetical protein